MHTRQTKNIEIPTDTPPSITANDLSDQAPEAPATPITTSNQEVPSSSLLLAELLLAEPPLPASSANNLAERVAVNSLQFKKGHKIGYLAARRGSEKRINFPEQTPCYIAGYHQGYDRRWMRHSIAERDYFQGKWDATAAKKKSHAFSRNFSK